MIKKIFLFLAFFALCSVCKAGGYDIKVRVVGWKDTVFYLGNHYGDKQYVRDTAKVNHEGWAEFKGKEPLDGGIYLVIMPTKTYFEILITENDQKFTVETDNADFINNFQVKGSAENKLFNEHQRFIIGKTKESQALKVRLDSAKTIKDSVVMKDSTKAIQEKMSKLDKDVKEYRMNLMKNSPKTFTAKILKTMKDPEVPEAPKDAKGNITDSTFQYRYYKQHYFDDVDFNDARLLRTPILQNKIKVYTEQLTVPVPDSIIESVDYIIEKSKVNKEVFKYCVATLANHYETSPIMGYDKIFVHIAERYYLTDQAYWADSTLKANIEKRVTKIKPNILMTPAHDLFLPDTAFAMHRLYDVKAKYIVLVFWDPTCSHCKKEIPKLAHYYDSVKAAKLDIEIFAIGIESELDLWKNYIKDNNLKWINVSDLYNNTHFRDFYDIYSTPVIYLLDDKKRIIAKRLDTEKIADFIEHDQKTTKPDPINPK